MPATRILSAILVVFTIISCEGPMGPAGPPGDPLGSLSDPSIMPKVIYSYPGANTTGPYPELYLYDCGFQWCTYYSQFQVRFNKFMDLTSVRRAVQLSSPVGDIHADTNFIISVGGDVFILNPVDSNGYRNAFRFKVGAAYSIDVDSTARDINGNPLVPPFTGTFVPEPVFRVMKVSPRDGEVDVSLSTYITLYFNSKVPRSILSHISLQPVLSGSWSLDYYDSSTVTFVQAVNHPISTEITVIVDDSAEDAWGNRIPAAFTSRFTTTPFRVTSTYPVNGALNVPMNIAPSVSFSVPLDSSTIRAAFYITPSTPGTMYNVYQGTNYISFTPDNGLLASTLYTVRIDSTLREMAGSRLTGGYEYAFTTAPFSVTSSSPPDGATGVQRYSTYQIYTNALIDAATVAGSIQISPATPLLIYTSDGATFFQFSASSSTGLAANTAYTVTIGTGLRTKRGEALPAPHAFSFTTGAN